jgi:hypothetical protein
MPTATKFSEIVPAERNFTVFYQDFGGFQSSNERNEPLETLYFIGIIDIFTEYKSRKRAETILRTMHNSYRNVSCVRPFFYGKRFIKFMTDSLPALIDSKLHFDI